MVKVDLFVYRDADKLLKEKGLYKEVKEILRRSIKRVDHREIQSEFYNKGWKMEKRIFEETTWAWDAYKAKVAVSVELSLIDAVHRDFLRGNIGTKTQRIGRCHLRDVNFQRAKVSQHQKRY